MNPASFAKMPLHQLQAEFSDMHRKVRREQNISRRMLERHDCLWFALVDRIGLAAADEVAKAAR
jgi:hypothetical protein